MMEATLSASFSSSVGFLVNTVTVKVVVVFPPPDDVKKVFPSFTPTADMSGYLSISC